MNINFASQRTLIINKMDQQNEHLKNIQEIRSIMDRSSRFISLSGLSGIFAGCTALLGALALFLYKQDFFYGHYFNQGIFLREDLIGGAEYSRFIFFILIDGFLTLLFAIFFGILFTARNARKKGLPFWDNSAKRMVINLFIPLIAGGLFCLVLLYHTQIYLIAPVTLIFYGLGLVNASKYTMNDIRYLGICEIILGLFATLFVGYGLFFWAFGFGILHIIYGSSMYWKYERFDNKSK
jgi:hypothetical protein